MSDTLLFCPMSMLSVKQTFLAIKSYDFGSIDFILALISSHKILYVHSLKELE